MNEQNIDKELVNRILHKDDMPMVVKFLGSLYKTRERHEEEYEYLENTCEMLISKEDWMLDYPTEDLWVEMAVDIAIGDPDDTLEWFEGNVPNFKDLKFLHDQIKGAGLMNEVGISVHMGA